jgi:hypothetical protein
MPAMTDEEADALDELLARAEAMHKNPSEIIGEMVRERIAVTTP